MLLYAVTNAWQTLFKFPAISMAVKSVLFIENSEKMKVLQEEKLSPYRDHGVELEWTDKVDEIPSCKFQAEEHT